MKCRVRSCSRKGVNGGSTRIASIIMPCPLLMDNKTFGHGLEWATRTDEEETKRSPLFGNFNFVYFKTVVGMLDGITECILFHVLILQIVFI